MLRLPALFTVPGDALAGVAAAGARPGPRTLLAIGSSLCLYEAGMVLNDWADRTEDAAERPHRPLPSGRVHPSAALTAACALTAAGLALAARAGRPALAVATPLAATVWAYDLTLKHTPAGPVAMAGARALDLLLGAATTGRVRPALPSAALLGTHTLAVTTVSRRETTGGSALAPLAALATTAVLTRLTARHPTRHPAGRREAASRGLPGPTPAATGTAPTAPDTARRPGGPAPGLGAEHRTTPALGGRGTGPGTGRGTGGGSRRGLGTAGSPLQGPGARSGSSREPLATALAAVYAATAARPYFHAALNPSPPLTQRAVGGGIRATIPLQAALAARAGAGALAAVVAGLAPLGRRFARKVSIT
ncbi:SCO3242 family prenyltransferase [Streptomyces fumanus]